MGCIDLTGERFGRLTVIKRAENDKQGNSRWLCSCECGGQITTRGFMLKSGRTLSCGCQRRESIAKALTKHGGSHTRLYHIWQNMKRRCYGESHKHYYLYGGRGIKICDEWVNDFAAFRDWALSHGYEEDLTIDRIDHDGDYEPSNCRWISMHEQARNKSTNTLVEYHGERACVTDMCKKLNVNSVTIRSRMKIHGLTFEQAVDDYDYTSPFVDYSGANT